MGCVGDDEMQTTGIPQRKSVLPIFSRTLVLCGVRWVRGTRRVITGFVPHTPTVSGEKVCGEWRFGETREGEKVGKGQKKRNMHPHQGLRCTSKN